MTATRSKHGSRLLLLLLALCEPAAASSLKRGIAALLSLP